jgi:Dyp-type peroxidase family
MSSTLNLSDIQGNINRAYGRFSFPQARYVFFQINDAAAGRAFVAAVSQKVTTAVKWGEEIPKPQATTNIAFTYQGLKQLGMPHQSLLSFPAEFIEGMKHRQAILGDDGASAPEHWDKIWQQSENIHIWVSINGQTPEAIIQRYDWLINTATENGITLLHGHQGDDGDNMPYQSAKAVHIGDQPSPYEHFGFMDGIGDPVFEGQGKQPEAAVGRGRLTLKGQWIPLRTGEFILGHIDEGGEYPAAPIPTELSRNGTFMVYRKLHQNVGTFNRYLDEQAQHFAGGKELLAAKMSGRWRQSGAPVTQTPDEDSEKAWRLRFAQADKAEKYRMLIYFDYNEDIAGSKCPVNAHIRRINPRGALEFGVKGAYARPTALVDRRRILRRGLPYGEAKTADSDSGNHGVIFMVLNSSIRRQFEFVQQQWINYANDSKQANDKDVLLGNHDATGRSTIAAEPDSGKPPYILNNIPRFVETRGGEYFFIPSKTALALIAAGNVDPT